MTPVEDQGFRSQQFELNGLNGNFRNNAYNSVDDYPQTDDYPQDDYPQTPQTVDDYLAKLLHLQALGLGMN